MKNPKHSPLNNNVNELPLITGANGEDTYDGGITRQFQWVTPNGHPVLYTTSGYADQQQQQADLRSCYDRMQFVGGPPNGLPPQFIAQGGGAGVVGGQVVPATGANIAYMTAPMAVNSVNFSTTPSSVPGTELTYADLGVIGAGGQMGIQGKKMHYTTATLGRPPRHPDLKRHEPTIYAQVRSGFPNMSTDIFPVA